MWEWLRFALSSEIYYITKMSINMEKWVSIKLKFPKKPKKKLPVCLIFKVSWPSQHSSTFDPSRYSVIHGSIDEWHALFHLHAAGSKTMSLMMMPDVALSDIKNWVMHIICFKGRDTSNYYRFWGKLPFLVKEGKIK